MNLKYIKDIKNHKLYINTDTLELVLEKRYTNSTRNLLEKIQRIAPLTNIPDIYQINSDGDNFTTYEQYIDGHSLQQMISDGTEIAINYFVRSAINLCDTINTLHEHNIIHKDIKPNNLIITNDQIFLIDFDISREQSEHKEQDTSLMGTKGYASPEQYGFSQTTEKSDIYSLGKTFEDVLPILFLTTDEQAKLEKLIFQMTSLDPEDRMTLGEVIQYLLENFMKNTSQQSDHRSYDSAYQFEQHPKREPRYFFGYIDASSSLGINILVTTFFIASYSVGIDTLNLTSISVSQYELICLFYYLLSIVYNWYLHRFSYPLWERKGEHLRNGKRLSTLLALRFLDLVVLTYLPLVLFYFIKL